MLRRCGRRRSRLCGISVAVSCGCTCGGPIRTARRGFFRGGGALPLCGVRVPGEPSLTRLAGVGMLAVVAAKGRGIYLAGGLEKGLWPRNAVPGEALRTIRAM